MCNYSTGTTAIEKKNAFLLFQSQEAVCGEQRCHINVVTESKLADVGLFLPVFYLLLDSLPPFIVFFLTPHLAASRSD